MKQRSFKESLTKDNPSMVFLSNYSSSFTLISPSMIINMLGIS